MVYEVALKLHFRGGSEVPYLGDVEAESAFQAVLLLMARCRLWRVAYAAARALPAGLDKRWIAGRGFWMEL